MKKWYDVSKIKNIENCVNKNGNNDIYDDKNNDHNNRIRGMVA